MATLNLGLSQLVISGSLQIVGTTLQFTNDVVSPGNNYVYSTNSSGTKGWFTLASFGVTSITGTANQITASASIGAITLSLPTALTSINSITAASGQALNFGSNATTNYVALTSGTAATAVFDLTALTKTGTATNSAAILGKSLGLSENAYVGGLLNVAGAATVGGSASFGTGIGGTAGLKILLGTSGFASGYGAIYPENVTPSVTNYAFAVASDASFTAINSATGGTIGLRINNVNQLTVTGSATTLAGTLTIQGTTAATTVNTGALAGIGFGFSGTATGPSFLGGSLTAAGTGTHTFGTTNTVTMTAGAITANAVGAHTFGTTNTVVMTAGAITANAVGAHTFGTTNTVTMTAGALNATSTGTFGGNVTAPDYLIGASGPSVKSSLGARGPRNGLVFDGTLFPTATISAIGTGDWTNTIAFTCPASNPSATITLFNFGANYASANTLNCHIESDGVLWILGFDGASASKSARLLTFVSDYAGKRVWLTVTQSAGTLTIYINGKSVSYTAGGSGNWNDTRSSTTYNVGGITSAAWVGYLTQIGLENRALSAAEVLALYEQGVPPSADYNSASNTSLVSGADSNFSAAGSWSLAGGATISGGKFNIPDGGQGNNPLCLLVIGRKYRFTITLDSITAGAVQYYNGSTFIAFATTPGTYTVEVTAAGTYSAGLTLKSVGGDSVLDTFTYYATGLLLAWDEPSMGAGSIIPAAPGTSAVTTLPASGVTYVVPTTYTAPYRSLLAQSTTPTAPASGLVDFADSSGRKSWRRASDGYVRTWDATLTGDRVYTLPDASGTVLLTTNVAAGVTTTGLNSITAAASTDLTLNAGSGNQRVVVVPTGTGSFRVTDYNHFAVGPQATLTMPDAGYINSWRAQLGLLTFLADNPAIGFNNGWNGTNNIAIKNGYGYATGFDPSTGIVTAGGFGTTTSGSIQSFTEWYRWSQAGNLLIGGTTDITGSGGLKVFGTTAAASSITGAFRVGNDTAATTVAIGGGNIYAGGLLNVAGAATVGGATLSLTAATASAIFGAATETLTIAATAAGAGTITTKSGQILTLATGTAGVTMSGTGNLITSGGRVPKIAVVTTSTVLDASYHIVVANSGAPLSLTLPSSPVTGQTYTVKSKGVGQVTLIGNGANLFTNTTVASFVMNTGDANVISFDGTVWIVS